MSKGDSKFKPGVSGNPAGRKPGVLNKVNTLAKQQLSDFYTGTMLPSLKEDWEKLSPGQRVKAVIDVSGFFIEKLRALDTNITTTMTDEDKQEIITKIGEVYWERRGKEVIKLK